MNPHSWSGWPGAFCLKCGAEDPREICLADHNLGLVCALCGADRPNPVCDNPENHHGPLRECSDHPMTDCPISGDPA